MFHFQMLNVSACLTYTRAHYFPRKKSNSSVTSVLRSTKPIASGDTIVTRVDINQPDILDGFDRQPSSSLHTNVYSYITYRVYKLTRVNVIVYRERIHLPEVAPLRPVAVCKEKGNGSFLNDANNHRNPQSGC